MDGMLFDDGGSAASQSNIIPRATVRDMVRRRQAALAAFLDAHRVMSEAATALPSAWQAYQSIGTGKENSYTHMTEQEDRNFLHSIKVPDLKAYTDTARKVVDRRVWSALIEATDLEKLMDKQAKDQFRQQLMENPPEATEENIFATVQSFAADAGTIFKRGIANCFTQLDRRFRSHDGWKIGNRVILTYCFDTWGSWSFRGNVRDTLHDIDRVFHVLDGGTTPELYGGIVAVVEKSRQGGGYGPRQSECESDYFKVRGFKNGNAHIWFKRDDLVEKVNKLLGEYYGAPIPEQRAAKADPLSETKTSLAKNYGFFPTPERAAETVIERSMLRHRDDGQRLAVLEPSAGTGNLASLAAKTGAEVDCVEYQAGLADKLARSGLYRSVTCGDFLTLQSHAARKYDRVIMNPPFDRERDIDHVMHAWKFLKPDGVLIAVMSAGTEWRETRKSIAFRDLMGKMKASWVDLPANSFASVGTNVNTIVLRVFADGRAQSGWY